MHASYNSLIHPSQRSKNVMLAVALASLAVAGLIVPFVWNVLDAINEMPKMAALHNALDSVPVFAWLMMFVWGAAIPLALLFALHQAPAHKLRNIVLVLALMVIAVTWYTHMPSTGRCDAMYPQAEVVCSALRWGFSTSLGLATAAYVFTVFSLALAAVGRIAACMGEDDARKVEHSN